MIKNNNKELLLEGIETKVGRIIAHSNRLLSDNVRLVEQNARLKAENTILRNKNEVLEGRIAALELRNGLLGSDSWEEGSRRANARLGALLREVDKCITLVENS